MATKTKKVTKKVITESTAPSMELDDWQQAIIETDGNICLRSGRQVGKSTIIAKKAAQFALDNPNKLIMVIAFVERQASLLFSKILFNLNQIDKVQIMAGKFKPTKHIIHLKNGSTIHCYAAGETGFGLMGFTVDLLIADEAAWIAPEVWNSVTPALAVTKGSIWLLSTPKDRSGYYYNCFEDPSFTSFHQSSEDCPRIPKEFLEQKKKEFTKAQYAQMYLGDWTSDESRLFTEEWIDRVCIVPDDNKKPIDTDQTALGCDLAGMGEDESSFEGIQTIKDKLYQFHHEITTKTRIPETIDKILTLDKQMDFWKIGVDSGGLGVGVFDFLLEDDQTRHKIVGLNNAKRVIDRDGRTSKLQKEAMYMTTLSLGEQGKLKLFDNPELRQSFASIQVDEDGRISGRYSHIVEGVIRAVELLKYINDYKLEVYSIKV